MQLAQEQHLKPELAWNILVGFQDAADAGTVTAAREQHSALLARTASFFAGEGAAAAAGSGAVVGEGSGGGGGGGDVGGGDVVVLMPCTCVEPFDLKMRYIDKIGELALLGFAGLGLGVAPKRSAPKPETLNPKTLYPRGCPGGFWGSGLVFGD